MQLFKPYILEVLKKEELLARTKFCNLITMTMPDFKLNSSRYYVDARIGETDANAHDSSLTQQQEFAMKVCRHQSINDPKRRQDLNK